MYKKLNPWGLILLLGLTAAQAEQEFLKPDQAFAISAQAAADEQVRFNWQIADGYYLYQSKFRFLSDTDGVEFGEPRLPPAETKDDPIFGIVEVYRDQVSIDVPLTAVPPGTEVLTLKARSQGCADAGICYPPHTQTVLVALNDAVDSPPPVDPRLVEEFAPAGSAPPLPAIAPAPARAQQDPLTELAALGDELGLGMQDDDILSPEDAFQVSADSPDG
ncbi:MAG: protein-disulfide reductase DsbD N-terminal domain-containing protein, partial [Chromatiaceae bacterium]